MWRHSSAIFCIGESALAAAAWLPLDGGPEDLARFAAARSLTARSLTLAFQTTTLSLRQATPFASEPGPRGDKSRRSKPGTGLPPGVLFVGPARGWLRPQGHRSIVMLSLRSSDKMNEYGRTSHPPAPCTCRQTPGPNAVPDDLRLLPCSADLTGWDGTPAAVVIISMRPQTRFRVGPNP